MDIIENSTPAFLKALQKVEKLSSLDPLNIHIKCWSHENQTFEEIIYKAYPFTTINDIKLHIYSIKKTPQWLPKQVFLGTPDSTPTETSKDRYFPADIQWFSSNRVSLNDFIILESPLKLSNPKSPRDRQFVNAFGKENPNNAMENRGRSTIQDVYLQESNEPPTFYAFNCSDMLTAFGVTEDYDPSEADWNGRFSMFFPALSLKNYKPRKEDNEVAEQFLKYKFASEALINKINQLIVEDEPTVSMNVINILGLQLHFDYDILRENENTQFPFHSVEDIFFETDVTSRTPFMRILPALEEPRTKIHVTGIIPIPDIADPYLLLQWKDEESPDPDADFLFLKVLVRGLDGGQLPLYATVRIFDDGTSTVTLVPSKQHRNGIDPNADMKHFDHAIFEGVSNTHLQGCDLILKEVSLTLNLHLEREDPHLSYRLLHDRLKYFNYFFQEIPNYYEDKKPIILLRYKAVSQYAVENNIFIFIRQYLSKSGSNSSAYDLVASLATEFTMTHNEAKEYINEYLKRSEAFTIVAPNLMTFIEDKNAGIDIAIFGSHPIYNIRISRCNSLYNLKYLYTLLSLYLTTSIKPDITEAEAVIVSTEEPTKETISGEDEEIPANNYGYDFSDDEEEKVIRDKILPPATTPKPQFMTPYYNNEDDEYGILFGGSAMGQTLTGGARRIPKEGEETELRGKSYYITQLRAADPRLFEFKPTIGVKGTYTRRCQANVNRQPIVLNPQEYARMRKEYADDVGLTIIEYPLTGPEPTFSPDNELVTVMKYGTNPSKPNYYICPTLFCIKDRIFVRENDFESTRWRVGYGQGQGLKPMNACPFCGGKEISDASMGKPGHTVLRRDTMDKSTKIATYIGFLSKTTHPDKYELPCCQVKPETYTINQPEFAEFLALAKKEQGIVEEASNIVEAAEQFNSDEVYFEMKRAQLPRQYILNPNQHPLKPGSFGLLGQGLDRYFNQNSQNLVKRTIRQELKATKGISGFLRMGVKANQMKEIGGQFADYNGFFGVLAPFLSQNTVDEVRQYLRSIMNPQLFISANYGNLLHEFYNPCDERPSMDELSQWSDTYLGVTPTKGNLYELQRAYMSYASFIDYLDGKKTFKEYRIFAPILAYKGLITHNGLILIVLEYDSVNLEKEPKIICPPFGYNPDLHNGCDFGFVLRDQNGIYEAICYYEFPHSNVPLTHLKFNPYTSSTIPPIVAKRIKEFTNKCHYNSPAIYSASSAVKVRDLIPLSRLISMPGIRKYLIGVVRDIYNHICGVCLSSGSGRYIPFPVSDDGYLTTDLYTFFDWSNVPFANAEKTYEFYNTNLKSVIDNNPGYKIQAAIRIEPKTIRALRLANGVVIPARGLITNLPEELQENIINGDTIEYEDNRILIVPENIEDECEESRKPGVTLPDDLQTISKTQLDELYQHFRLSFSHWISSSDVSEDLIKHIEKIILRNHNDLPVYEKRKRLMLLLYDALSKWFVETPDYIPARPFIKRKDCLRITSAGKCTDACVWKKSPTGSSGKCKIHVPELNSLMVSTKNLFIHRLIDELILFKEQRKELLGDTVKTTISLRTAIQVDDQLIIPESSPTWLDLLRLEWSKKSYEVPKYYEEIVQKSSKTEGENGEESPVHEEEVARRENLYALGDELLGKLNILDQNKKWSLWLARPGPEALLRIIDAESIINTNTNSLSTINADIIRKLVQLKGYPIYHLRSITDSDVLNIKLYLPNSYREQRVVPRALVIIQLDTQLDDGTTNSIYTILISHKDFNYYTYINDLPAKLEMYYDNRLRLLSKGVIEFVKPDEDLMEPEAIVPKTLRLKRRKTKTNAF
jgi:hypothetical protein